MPVTRKPAAERKGRRRAKNEKTLRAYSIQELQLELDVTRNKLERGIAREQLEPVAHTIDDQHRWHLKPVIDAIRGDVDREKIRKLSADADRSELKAAQERTEVVAIDDVISFTTEIMTALRERILMCQSLNEHERLELLDQLELILIKDAKFREELDKGGDD